MLALGEVNQIEHVGRETEAVAELLDEHADIHCQKAGGAGIAEVYEGKAGE